MAYCHFGVRTIRRLQTTTKWTEVRKNALDGAQSPLLLLSESLIYLRGSFVLFGKQLLSFADVNRYCNVSTSTPSMSMFMSPIQTSLFIHSFRRYPKLQMNAEGLCLTATSMRSRKSWELSVGYVMGFVAAQVIKKRLTREVSCPHVELIMPSDAD